MVKKNRKKGKRVGFGVKFALFLLFLLSFLLIFYNLSKNPTFISDEASIGYNAYSILKTGRDEWGNFLPLAFKAFGEYKLPVYIYLTTLSVALFGVSPLAVRFPSAFLGILSGWMIFLLAARLFKAREKNNFLLALVVLFLWIINPWHIQTSRIALEANVGLFLFLAGFWYFLKEDFVPVAILWGLTFYTYNTFRVFIPFFVFLNLFFRKWEAKKLLLPVLVFVLIICPLLFSGFKGSGERIFKVSIFSDRGIVGRIEQKRVECQKHVNPGICRLAYNRPVVYTSEVFKNYLSHFDPRFLFTRGAGLAQYTMPQFGVLNFFEAFLFPFGFWLFLKDRELMRSLLPWLVAAPVATSLTGPAHPVRSLILLPILVFLSGLGFEYWQNRFLKSRWVVVFGVLFVGFCSFGYFGYRYFVIYPEEVNSIWQAGYPPLFEYLEENEDDFSQIRLSKFYGEPHVFYLFNREIDPVFYQDSGQVARYDREDRWINVDRIGKYYFFEKPDWETPGLVVLAPYESQPELEIKEHIRFPNGSVAFNLYEIYEK